MALRGEAGCPLVTGSHTIEGRGRSRKGGPPMPGKISRKARGCALVSATLLSGALLIAVAQPSWAQTEGIPKKGTTPYATHFIFKPVTTIEIPGLGTATALEA